MYISGSKISAYLEELLRKEIKKLKKKPPLKLTTFLIGSSEDQLSFVKIKERTAKRLGIRFELVHYKESPSFEEFMHKIKERSNDPQTTGIIIQQPLPAQLSTESIYNYIPSQKEIEGHKKKSLFLPPIGLATLTVLKFIFTDSALNSNLFIQWPKDKRFFKSIMKNKRVVLVGRGITGGLPVGKTLSEAKINYISINSQTPEPELYFKEADFIITAVGKKILKPEDVKSGVILINIGLRKERNKLKGDYDEAEMKTAASFYTPTPGGIGPIDVLYLYKNLVEAAKLQ